MKRLAVDFRYALAFLLTFLLLHQTLLAQVDSSWEQVQQIKKGKKVQVRLFSGKTLDGKMEAWSVDDLTVRQPAGAGPVTLVKSDVAEVVALGTSRGSKALIAFLAGALVAWQLWP